MQWSSINSGNGAKRDFLPNFQIVFFSGEEGSESRRIVETLTKGSEKGKKNNLKAEWFKNESHKPTVSSREKPRL